MQGETPAILLKTSIIELCALIKKDAVGLVDAIAPTDFFVNSVLGMSDGQVSKNFNKI